MSSVGQSKAWSNPQKCAMQVSVAVLIKLLAASKVRGSVVFVEAQWTLSRCLGTHRPS